MTTLITGLSAWVLVGAWVAVRLGRGIALADRVESRQRAAAAGLADRPL